MSIVLRAFPIKGSLDNLQALVDSMREKGADCDSFFRKYGVTHESWHLQQTPMGPWVLGLSIVDDPVAVAPVYADAKTGFDAWFKAKVAEVTGVDLNTSPLGPPTEEIYRWSDRDRPNAALV